MNRSKRALAKITRMSPDDIFRGVGVDMYRDGYERGLSLSGYMERLNPTEPGDQTGLDAFGRVIRAAGIYPSSAPEYGVYADVYEDAFDGTGEEGIRRRALGMEWMARTWRRASTGSPVVQRRDVMTSQDYPVNTALRPYMDAAAIRNQQLEPAVPLSALVAITTPIQGDAYRAVYIEDIDPNAKRFVRVGETAEIPRITMKTSTRTIDLFKYGRAIEQSYEVMRRMRLDRLAIEIALIALQVTSDKIETILDVILNGDGNAGTAAPTYALTTLDPDTTANNPTLAAWIAFRNKFRNPYRMTVLLGQEGAITKLMLINTGTDKIPLVAIASSIGLGGFRLINSTLSNEVGYGLIDNAPASKWVALDSRLAIEHVTEIGSNLAEVENYAIRQTKVIVLSEVEGFTWLDRRGAKVANLAA